MFRTDRTDLRKQHANLPRGLALLVARARHPDARVARLDVGRLTAAASEFGLLMRRLPFASVARLGVCFAQVSQVESSMIPMCAV